MPKSDHEYFNCSEDHEYEYVIHKKYKLNKNTNPTAQEVWDYIENTLCENNKSMTHKFLYEEIEKKYLILKKKKK